MNETLGLAIVRLLMTLTNRPRHGSYEKNIKRIFEEENILLLLIFTYKVLYVYICG